MLATLSGDLCLLFGLALLLLPLLAVELSRPRDAAWGAIVLLLGLVLVTSSDRLRGAPMLAVLCSTLLISRLSIEVSQARWQALSETERENLSSLHHWLTGFKQLGSAAAELSHGISGIAKQLKPNGKSGVSGKRWVRPETTNDFNPAAAAEPHPDPAKTDSEQTDPATIEVATTEVATTDPTTTDHAEPKAED